MIAIAVAGLVFGREASQNQVIGIIDDLVGVQGARALQAMIETAGQKPDSGVFAAGVGIILLLLGAGGVVEQLQHSLNTIWRVAPKTGRGIREFRESDSWLQSHSGHGFGGRSDSSSPPRSRSVLSCLASTYPGWILSEC
jgi:uncharacterized BrkB/YihY/UPF0761 family membrane protein